MISTDLSLAKNGQFLPKALLIGALAYLPVTGFAENPGAVSQPFGFGLQLAQSDFEIPSVPGRPDPFDLQAGPTLTIERIEAYELDVSGSVPKRSRIRDSGFQAVIDDYMTRQEGKFTFGILQELANQLTAYLRQQENLLANVYVPSQQVEDGVVRFDVLMGKLGDVEVRGNKYYQSEDLMKAFTATKGKNVKRAEIEESMLILQEYPGISAGGTFVPGQNLGETRLVININEEDRFAPTFFADNYGSDFTGRNRYGVHLELHNPFRIHDQLTLDAVLVDKPNDVIGDPEFSDRLYGGVSYVVFPWGPRWGIGAETSANSYIVGNTDGQDGVAALGLTGEVKTYRVFAQHKYQRDRSTKLDFEFGLNVADAETTRAGELQSRDDLTFIELSANYQKNDDWFGGGVSFVNVRLVQGFEDFLGSMGAGGDQRDGVDPNTSRRVFAPAEFIQCGFDTDEGCNPITTRQTDRNVDGDFLKAEYNLLRFQRLRYFNALVTFAGQETRDPLVSVQQSSIGGPYNVRAYPTGAFLGDKTMFGSIEFIRPFFENRLQVSAFYDYGNGKNFEVASNAPKEVSLHGPGIGIRWQFNEYVNMNLTAAWARGALRNIDVNGETVNNQLVFGQDAAGRDNPMVYFSMLLGL